MLPPALLHVADRLIATLMTLVDAIFPVALNGSTPTFSEHAAHTLYIRLNHLIAALIRIANFGIRTRAGTAPNPAQTQPAPIAARPSPALALPRRPGWLLDALPDIAPAVASDLAALLADPALTTLLAASPSLHRTLRPLLRSLGLTQPPPPSAPSPLPPIPTPNHPLPLAEASPTIQTAAPNLSTRPKLSHVQIITI